VECGCYNEIELKFLTQYIPASVNSMNFGGSPILMLKKNRDEDNNRRYEK
jgi:hypothetical protein